MSRLLAILGFASVFLAIAHGQIAETVDEDGIEWVGPIRKCKLGSTDEELDECVAQIALDITSNSADGIPELGLQPLDPFKLAKLDFSQKFGPFNIELRAKNIVLHGMTKYRSIDFKVDTKNKVMRFAYDLPVVRIEADYKLGGNVIIPLTGSGPATINVPDVRVSGYWNIKKVTREDGVQIIKLEKAVIEKMTVGGLNLRARGLFNGNPILSGFIHYVGNNYGQAVFEVIKPFITDTVGDIITNALLNPVLSKLPFVADYIPS